MSDLQVREWKEAVANCRSVFVVHTRPMSKEQSAEELQAALEVRRLTLSVEQLKRLAANSRPPEGFSVDADW